MANPDSTAPSSLIRSFLDYKRVERQVSVHTLDAYGHDLREFCDFLGGKEPAATQQADVRKYLLDCNARSLTPASINRRISTLREFFKHLQRDRIMQHDPIRHISLLKRWKRVPKAISETEAMALVDCPGPTKKKPRWNNRKHALRDQAIVELLWATGIRVGELVTAKLHDLNLDNRSLRVFGKGQKERIVPFGLAAARALQAYLAEPESRHVKQFQSPFLFPGRHGKSMTRMNAWNLISQRAARAGLVHLSPHALRHTCATHLIQHGADLRVVQEILGHAEVSTTQIYLRVTPVHLKDILFRCHPRSNPTRAQMKLFEPKPLPVINAHPCIACAAPAVEGKGRCERHLRQTREAVQRYREARRPITTETPKKPALGVISTRKEVAYGKY